MSETQTDSRNRRRFFRFSLSTLLLFVLFAASVATAAWRWQAWMLVRSFVNDDHGHAFFATGKKILVYTGTHWNTQTSVFNLVDGSTSEIPYVEKLSPDGQWAVANDYDLEKSFLIRIGTKARVQLADLFEYKAGGCFSPDSRLLMIPLSYDTLCVYSVESAKALYTFHRNGQADNYGFAADSKFAYALAWGSSAYCWDALTGKLRGEIRNSSFSSQCTVLAPDSKTLLAAGSDSLLRFYSLPALKLQNKTPIELDDYPYTAVFSGDMALIATTSWSGTVQIWSRRSGYQLCKLKSDAIRSNALAFSPDGKHIATGGVNSTAYIWDTSGRPIQHMPGQLEPNLFTAPVFITSKDEAKQEGNSESEDMVEEPKSSIEEAWDLKEQTLLEGHKEQILEAKYLDSSILMTRSADDIVHLWDVETGENIHPSDEGDIIAVSHDGRLAAVRNSDAKKINVWAFRRRQNENRLLAQPEIILGFVFLILLLRQFYRALKGVKR